MHFKILLLAGASVCACAMLSGCGTLLPGAPSIASQTEFVDNLNKLNAAAAQNCAGGGDFSWTPPLPPTGSMHLHCEIGGAAALTPGGGTFGGAGASGSVAIVPLSQLQALLRSGQTAAPPAAAPTIPPTQQ